jgi:hypothetical protein
MKTFNKQAAQGDMILRRIIKVPTNVKVQVPDGQGRHVVTHSETGHHHWVGGDAVTLYRPENDKDGMVSYIEVKAGGTDLIHERPWDTHETLHIEEGTYEVRRQREYTPEGWRRVED